MLYFMVSLEAVVNNLEEGIFLFDEKGRLVFTNKAGEEFIGRSYKELKHIRFKDLFSDAEEIVMLVRKTIDEGRSFNYKEMEVDIGRAANIDLNLSPFYLDNRLEGALLCIRENLSLTEREDYHFDSLLYLLGSVAHEIKNPLSGIKGAAQILMRQEWSVERQASKTHDPRRTTHDALECVGMILKEADRLNSVLHSYLTMTRRPVLNQLNIHEVIEHALKVMRPDLEKKKITVTKLYDPSLPNIAGDESKLLQVFINLLKNAVEAMKSARNRLLHISTRPSEEYMVIYESRGAGSRNSGRKKQRWLVISIEDSGSGMPRDEINRIFLPFYTKKEGGSGLGLSLSKKIIKDHGGIIKVKSKEGSGSTFSVYLPLQVTSNRQPQ